MTFIGSVENGFPAQRKAVAKPSGSSETVTPEPTEFLWVLCS